MFVVSLAVIVTFFMTWTVMPWMARVLQDWLYAPPGRH
jgi:antibiotic biosynthesis monooxygenase (ABM) superfamily enzyme